MNRFDRIVAILIKLQTRRVITAAELAESFGVSQRTIYRDIRSLENAGVPVGDEAGVGYYLSPGYHLPPVAFTADEAAALLVGGRFVRTHAPGATSQAYEGALAKVRSVLKTRDKDAVVNLDGSVAVYPNGPHRRPPSQPRRLHHGTRRRRRSHRRGRGLSRGSGRVGQRGEIRLGIRRTTARGPSS